MDSNNTKLYDDEIWKIVPDFPNYEVSSYGRVKHKLSKKCLKQTLSASNYNRCLLLNCGFRKMFFTHRIVALTFIDNPENKPTVNHIDRNKLNNQVSNLEWATHSEQNIHKSKPTKLRSHTLKVARIDISTNNELEVYCSLRLAAQWVISNGLSNASEKSVMTKISSVANNKKHCNTSFGYKWIYKNKGVNSDNYKTIDGEIWKEIPNNITETTNPYFVSNYGRFKSASIFKTHYAIINGYNVVSIKGKTLYLHRLVGLTFLDNPENKKCINHKDGNKLNNRLENLEWATNLENNIHAIETGLSKQKKQVTQYDSEMNIIAVYNSVVECSKQLNLHRSTITDNCNGRTDITKGGYIFRYT